MKDENIDDIIDILNSNQPEHTAHPMPPPKPSELIESLSRKQEEIQSLNSSLKMKA